MIPTTIQLLDQEDIPRLNLDTLTIHTRYRGHPALSQADHQNLFRHELASAVKSGGVCASVSCESKTVAACAIKPLSWDTQHFGLPMAKLTLAANSNYPSGGLQQLLKETIGAARKSSANMHLSCEIDIDDYFCLNALLGLGAEILDIKREYRWTSLKGIQAPKFLSLVREYRPSDKPQCMQLMEKTHFESRFSRDTQLNPDKTKELYQIWLEKLLDSGNSDRIALVIEKNGQVQACGTIEQQDLSYADMSIQMMNSGIYISSPEATGSYYPIIYALAERSLACFDSVQTCVSLNNHPASRVLEKMHAGTESTRYALRLCL